MMDGAQNLKSSPRSLQPGDAKGRWEVAHQWRLAWRSLKWTAVGLIGLAAFFLAGQVFLFQQMFSEIHPALGWVFVVVIAALCTWLVGLPLMRFFYAPAIARPPDVDLSAGSVPLSELKRRIAYDDTYLKGMARNPALGDNQAAAAKARVDLEALKNKEVDGLAKRLADFERERIATLLVDLDNQIDDYIHKEALAVGSATAISMNGSVDAFVVLWRNVNMVSRISRLYYGRPSLRLSLTIMRDVTVAVLLSRALDDVTDAAGEALGGVISKFGGMVVGPMMDGSVNALMTTKLGYLAKRRCRSFNVWSEASAQRATIEVFEQVKRESSSLIKELVKMSGGVFDAAGNVAGAAAHVAGGVVGAATDTAGKMFAAPKSAWALVQDTFVRKPDAKNED